MAAYLPSSTRITFITDYPSKYSTIFSILVSLPSILTTFVAKVLSRLDSKLLKLDRVRILLVFISEFLLSAGLLIWVKIISVSHPEREIIIIARSCMIIPQSIHINITKLLTVHGSQGLDSNSLWHQKIFKKNMKLLIPHIIILCTECQISDFKLLEQSNLTTFGFVPPPLKQLCTFSSCKTRIPNSIFIPQPQTRKGIDYIIDYSSLNRYFNQIQFFIVDCFDDQLVRSCLLNCKNVSLVPKQSWPQMANMYRMTSFTYVYSKSEGFSQVVLESYVYGNIPIVSPNIPALSYMPLGSYIEAHDVNELNNTFDSIGKGIIFNSSVPSVTEEVKGKNAMKIKQEKHLKNCLT